MTSEHSLFENTFRSEYGRLVSMLSRQVGLEHLALIEDAVQSALVKALETSSTNNKHPQAPDNLSAWLYKVAKNQLISQLRQDKNQQRLLNQYADELIQTLEKTAETLSVPRFTQELDDDLLRMLFVCCHKSLPTQTQLIFALKTLCGFTINEIAHRLFYTEANVYKRYNRAKNTLKNYPLNTWELENPEYTARLPNLHKILYLLFTEGYLSVNTQYSLRQELCQEAIRLSTLLNQHPIGQTPETYALLALMHLQLARMHSRQNTAGELLLLKEQDRSQWNKQHIQIGLTYLQHSAQGDTFSRYHAEAGIAAEHCLSPSYQETRWDRIADNYQLLEQQAPSPIHRLNRAVAIAESQGPKAGLNLLKDFEAPTWLTGSYLWFAVLADLHHRCHHKNTAQKYREKAIELAPNTAIKHLLKRKYASLT